MVAGVEVHLRGLLACVVVLTMAADAQTLAGADSQYEQKIPGDNSGYYDDSNYIITRVLGAAVVGIVIAILSCILGWCFCCVQLCSKALTMHTLSIHCPFTRSAATITAASAIALVVAQVLTMHTLSIDYSLAQATLHRTDTLKTNGSYWLGSCS